MSSHTVSPAPRPSVKVRATSTATLPAPYQVWRLPTVEQVTGHKKSFLYSQMALGRFPRPIPTGNRAKGWLAHEVIAWVEQRAAMRS